MSLYSLCKSIFCAGGLVLYSAVFEVVQHFPISVQTGSLYLFIFNKPFSFSAALHRRWSLSVYNTDKALCHLELKKGKNNSDKMIMGKDRIQAESGETHGWTKVPTWVYLRCYKEWCHPLH